MAIITYRIFLLVLNVEITVQIVLKITQINVIHALMAHIYHKIHAFDAIKVVLHAMVHQQPVLIVMLVLFTTLELIHAKIVLKIVYNAIKLGA